MYSLVQEMVGVLRVGRAMAVAAAAAAAEGKTRSR